MLNWIKRASRAEKEEMQAIVDAENELAHEHEDCQYIPFYRLERGGDAWAIVQYVDKSHPDFADVYTHGQRIDAGSFVRCSECGDVRDFWEGQFENCYECGA